MSDPNRPFGDTSDDQDLNREPTADAPNDADALDALLNEIASSNGPPGTRRHAPNARSEDAASVLATAAAFHRQVETAQGRDARAAGPDPQLWETIMARTSSATAPISGERPRPPAPPATARPAASRGHVHNADLPHKRAAIRRPAWQALANFALVVALLVVGFGAWRAAGSPGLPGDGDVSRPVPNFAMQPATPDGTPPSGVAPVPVATPAPTTACDFSADIPLFQRVDASPWDGTAVLLTTAGEAVLSCPEEPEDTVLATTTGQASVAPVGWPQEWPGAVMIHDGSDESEHPRVRVVSLITADIVEFGVVISESRSVGVQHAPGSPWVVGPAPGDPADVQILDLRTMQTRLLSDIAGTTLPTHGGYLMSIGGDGNTLVLGLLKSAHPTEGNATLVTSGLPGDLLVLNASLDAASWMPAPENFPPVVGFEVSPDGRYVALHGTKGTMQERGHTWSIVRLYDGSEIARSATVTTGPEPAEAVWTDVGLVSIDGSALMLLTVEGGSSWNTVFRGNGSLTNLRATTNPSVVLVDKTWGDELATMAASAREPTRHSVDVTTGEASTITGVDVSANTHPWPYPTRFLVTFDYTLESRDAITYRVVDAITGETVGTLDDVPLNQSGYEGYPMLGPRSVVSSADGQTEVIAFDTQHIYLMTVMDGEPTVRQLASPDGLPASYPLMAQMFLSADGTLLSLTAEGDEARTRWLLPLDGEPDDWVTVENASVGDDPGYIFFVPGTGS